MKKGGRGTYGFRGGGALVTGPVLSLGLVEHLLDRVLCHHIIRT